MNYCEICDVQFDGNENQCPLCPLRKVVNQASVRVEEQERFRVVVEASPYRFQSDLNRLTADGFEIVSVQLAAHPPYSGFKEPTTEYVAVMALPEGLYNRYEYLKAFEAHLGAQAAFREARREHNEAMKTAR